MIFDGLSSHCNTFVRFSEENIEVSIPQTASQNSNSDTSLQKARELTQKPSYHRKPDASYDKNVFIEKQIMHSAELANSNIMNFYRLSKHLPPMLQFPLEAKIAKNQSKDEP